jgi:hypothetical protein
MARRSLDICLHFPDRDDVFHDVFGSIVCIEIL